MKIETIMGLSMLELSKLAEHIGNTPMQSIVFNIQNKVRTVHLKMEGENPTGSIKDRTGIALIEHLEKQKILHKGSVVVESTSGNLGVALSLLCKARGYCFIAVVDPKTTQENIVKMQALGAHIEMVHQPDRNGGYLLSRLEHVQVLCRNAKHYVWTDQYKEAANPYTHYSHTGPEIYQQMCGQVDTIFIPVSTGGTLAGIGKFFREVSPSTCIIGVDAYGSVIFGTPPAPRKLTGIGSSRPSNFIHRELYNSYMLVRDEEAFAFCRALYAIAGLKVGGSSGAALAACARYLIEHPNIENVVCICADDGENYASSIFNDEWIHEQSEISEQFKIAEEHAHEIIQTI